MLQALLSRLGQVIVVRRVKRGVQTWLTLAHASDGYENSRMNYADRRYTPLRPRNQCRKIPAATETFSESACGPIGIVTRS